MNEAQQLREAEARIAVLKAAVALLESLGKLVTELEAIVKRAKEEGRG